MCQMNIYYNVDEVHEWLVKRRRDKRMATKIECDKQTSDKMNA